MNYKQNAGEPSAGTHPQESRSNQEFQERQLSDQIEFEADLWNSMPSIKPKALKRKRGSLSQIFGLYGEHDGMVEGEAEGSRGGFDATKVRSNISNTVDKMLGKGGRVTGTSPDHSTMSAVEYARGRDEEMARGRGWIEMTEHERRVAETARQVQIEKWRAEAQVKSGSGDEEMRNWVYTEVEPSDVPDSELILEKIAEVRLRLAQLEVQLTAVEEKEPAERAIKEDRRHEKRLGLIVGERESWGKEKEVVPMCDGTGHLESMERMADEIISDTLFSDTLFQQANAKMEGQQDRRSMERQEYQEREDLANVCECVKMLNRRMNIVEQRMMVRVREKEKEKEKEEESASGMTNSPVRPHEQLPNTDILECLQAIMIIVIVLWYLEYAPCSSSRR